MSRCSSYQEPCNWTNRVSGSYHYVAIKYDTKFNRKISILSAIMFALNLAMTALWLGLSFRVWTNWGIENNERFESEKEDCSLAKFHSVARGTASYPISLLFNVTWSDGLQAFEIQAKGHYAVTSTLTFQCIKEKSTCFHHLKTSRGESIEDKAFVGCTEYRSSLIYAVFVLAEGDTIFVQTNCSKIQYNRSHLSLFRIRNHLRCPRQLVNPQIDSKMVRENGSLRDDQRFYRQKVYRDAHQWWHDGYLSTVRCKGSKCTYSRLDLKM